MAISKRKRFEVIQRDGRRCYYCRSAGRPLTLDHVMPRSVGGSDDMANLVAACASCNFGKGPMMPDDRTIFEAAAWSCVDRFDSDATYSADRLFSDAMASYWFMDDVEQLLHAAFSPCLSAARVAELVASYVISAHRRGPTIQQVENYSDPLFCEKCCTVDAAAYNCRPGRLFTMRPLTGFELVQ